MKSNFGIVIQARLNSSRLKRKIFLKINGKTILDYMIDQLKNLNDDYFIIIATTYRKIDDQIIQFCKDRNINFFRGSEKNVLKRYYDTCKRFNLDHVVRLTSDCPLIDPLIILKLHKIFIKENLDYITTDDTFPDGTDVEIIRYKALRESFLNANFIYEKEHPTQYIHNNYSKFRYKKISYKPNYNNIRYTLDYSEDLILLKKVLNKLLKLKMRKPFKMQDIINIIKTNNFNKINSHIVRNEGLIISKKLENIHK